MGMGIGAVSVGRIRGRLGAVKEIDLRSDTVTRPVPAMREAMAGAEVGDDVYGEDPTVNRLQELAAERLGVEAALLVPSGTMGNLSSLLALTRPGDMVLAGENAHVLRYEAGGAWALAGVQVQTIGRGGFFDAADVGAAVNPDESHFAPTRVVAVENTHNYAGGRVFPLAQVKEVAMAARDRDLLLHMDASRIFNAAIATGIPAATWARPFDTVTFCLSKGLGAPVGSLVCGSAAVIRRVHRARKRLGGGMRQAGILAAAGLYALEHHVERLAEDHANARRLATGLEKLGFPVEGPTETNIAVFGVEDTMGFLRATRARGLLINPIAEGRFRAVTHLDVSESDIDEALHRIAEVTEEGTR
jgi:threonine aldolase